MDYMKTYNEWLNSPYFDEETKKELLEIEDNENEIKERFAASLEFGTAGLRGVVGAGTNRMNIYIIRKATQRFCKLYYKTKWTRKRCCNRI